MNNGFGEIIRRERKKREWTLKELSEMTDMQVTPSYINKLEKGEQTNPGFQNVLSLVWALGLDVEEVFFSFGFHNIVNPLRRSSSLEQLLRTREIEHPWAELAGRNSLSSHEKEAIITTLNKAFQYVYGSDDNQKAERLLDCIKAIIEWKGNVDSPIKLTSLNLSITFSEEAQTKQDWNWSEDFERVLEKNRNLLKAHDNLNFSVQINDKEWMVEKKGFHLYVIGEKEDFVRFEDIES